MPKTAPDCVRYTIVGSWTNGRAMNAVLEAEVVPDLPASRATAIGEYAVILANAWDLEICPILANNYTAIRVDWVDLDSDTGTTGSAAGTLPQAGGLAGASWSPAVARLVTKTLVGGGRGDRKGRLFLGPAEETDISEDGALNGPANVRDQQGLDDFLAAATVLVAVGTIATARLGVIQWPSISIQPPVKRVTDPDGVGAFLPVNELVEQLTVSTQRRRQRP